ncbi:unnamed protein product [Camellia sinensis]
MKRDCSQMPEAEGCLYLIFMYSGGKYSHSFHRIELSHLNLSSEGESSSQETKKLPVVPEPLVKLPYESYPGFMSFVHFDGKIYMFGGEQYCPGKQGKLSERCYVFDTYNNPKNDVNDGPPMKKAKFRPIVLGPIGDTFYVLSSNLASRDLEKFEPKSESWDKSWSVLDQFPFASKGRQHKYEVFSYAIVKNLLIFSTRKGIFTYHVKENYWTSSRGEKDDGINMGTLGDQKTNTLGAESSEKDNWKAMDSLGGEEMKMLPFIDEAKLLDHLRYAFSSPKEFALAAYDFNVGKRELHSYEVRGLVFPSGIVEDETVNIMVPLKGKKFCIVSSSLYGCGEHFYVTVDMYQLSETTGGSNDKSKYVEVSKKSSATYVKDGYERAPLTTTCVFAGGGALATSKKPAVGFLLILDHIIPFFCWKNICNPFFGSPTTPY